jgi:L-seryl-tRNA(Ser) seleniumtransferase
VPAAYRDLPSVDRLLADSRVSALLVEYSASTVTDLVRQHLDDLRLGIAGGRPCPPFDDIVSSLVERAASSFSPTLRPAINATGVIVHTNLGRAPLSDETLAAMAAVGRGYSNLEFDLGEGGRGSRFVHLEALLCRLTGAEAAIAVNNNASAVLLALSALAQGREVIISRGQLVEIGGGFRIPDVMRQSGACLVEVGTTNRTYLQDYEESIGGETAALMRVHQQLPPGRLHHSVSVSDLAGLAHQHSLLLLDDLGSGCLLDTRPFGLAPEPTPQESLTAGADLVLFSGDKLLGGPQAGIALGRRELVETLRSHPLARAVRLDKTSIAGLSVTLLHYLRGEALTKVPVWRMIAAPWPTWSDAPKMAQACRRAGVRRGGGRPLHGGGGSLRRRAAYPPAGPRRRWLSGRGRACLAPARRLSAGRRAHRARHAAPRFPHGGPARGPPAGEGCAGGVLPRFGEYGCKDGALAPSGSRLRTDADGPEGPSLRPVWVL